MIQDDAVRSWVALIAIGAWSCGGHDITARSVHPARSPDRRKQPVASTFGKTENGEIKKQARFELDGDTAYGWRIKLPCTGPTKFRETLQLPAVGDWTFDLDTTKEIRVSADKTRAVMTDYSGCYDGWIEHAWTVTLNDPAGEYVLTVEIDGYVPQTFRATFVKRGDGDGDGAREQRRLP
jgi:hypothetical protein